MMPNPSLNGSKATIRSYRTLNFFFGPEKYRCLVAKPKRPVSWWTVSSHSTLRLRKVPGRQYMPCVIRMRWSLGLLRSACSAK